MYFVFFCNLIIPIVMIAGGYFIWKHTPQKINSFIGYRTGYSMKNKDTWLFANRYIGKLWWKTGWIILVLSAAVSLLFCKVLINGYETAVLILLFIQFVVLMSTIFLTEKALKRNFTENGLRKLKKY